MKKAVIGESRAFSKSAAAMARFVRSLMIGATVTIGGSGAAVTGTTATTVTFTTSAHAAGLVDVTETTAGGSATSMGSYRYLLRGDVDADGSVTAADEVSLSDYLFAGGSAPIGSGDTNSDGSVSVADVLYFINYLFAGGPGTGAVRGAVC